MNDKHGTPQAVGSPINSIKAWLVAIRLRSLPVQNPRELAEMKIVGGNQGMGLNQQYGELTRPLWELIRDKHQAFSGTFAWSANQRYIGRGSEMRHFNQLLVSGEFFACWAFGRSAGVCWDRGMRAPARPRPPLPATRIGKANWADATCPPS